MARLLTAEQSLIDIVQSQLSARGWHSFQRNILYYGARNQAIGEIDLFAAKDTYSLICECKQTDSPSHRRHARDQLYRAVRTLWKESRVFLLYAHRDGSGAALRWIPYAPRNE